MPDHLHLIISGRTSESDTLLAMEKFKQASGWWFKQNLIETKWGRGFYDRIIRNAEEYVETIRYVLNNPVRAGLVENWEDYPFKGAVGLDLNLYLNKLPPY